MHARRAVRGSKLTENFTYSELFGDRVMRPHQIAAGVMLLASVVQPMRGLAGPMTITRGYSTPEANAAAGGSATSMHLFLGDPEEPTTWGAAVDVNFDKMHGHDPINTAKRYRLARELEPWLRIAAGEFIWYPHTCHFHLGLRNAKNAGQLMVCTAKGKYITLASMSDLIQYDPRLRGASAL